MELTPRLLLTLASGPVEWTASHRSVKFTELSRSSMREAVSACRVCRKATLEPHCRQAVFRALPWTAGANPRL